MRPTARLVLSAAALVGLLLGFGGTAGAAHGTGEGTPPFSPRVGAASGLVPPRTVGAVSGDRFADQCPCGNGDLTYHGGSVMLTNRAYNIYWEPTGWSHPFPVGYRQKIDQYLADVAYDSSLRTNVYAVATQYYDTIGGMHHIAYDSTYGGSILDSTSFPASGCTDAVAQTTVCLTDSQMRDEIDHVVAAQGWPRGGGAVYFLYTPFGVGSGYGSGVHTHYAYTSYCAYHSTYYAAAGATLYAIQPFTKGMTADGVHAACEALTEYPNGASTGADPTISVVSHEHNEAITDWGSGWRDSIGWENGDKCAWSYGALSGAAGTRYNQVINGHHYLTQLEWNNSGAALAQKCVQSMPVLPPTLTSFSPGTGAIGSYVTINGTGFGNVTAVRFNGTAATFSVPKGTRIVARVPAGATTGTISVSTPAGTATSVGNYVLLPPTITGFSPPGGKTGSFVTVFGTNLAGVTAAQNGLMPMRILTNSGTWLVAQIKDWGTYSPVAPLWVSSSAGSATSATNYAVTFGIANVFPRNGSTGALITLSGRGFNGTSRIGMSKNGTPGIVPASVASNGTSLTFHVPAGWAGSHQLTVTNSLGVTGTVYSYWLFTKT